MQTTQLLRNLGRNDIKIIRRDRFLIFMFLFAVIIALALRNILPALDAYMTENEVLKADTFIPSLSAIYPMLVAYMALYTGGLLVGTVFGFMLLDEKDDNTLKAILVTPVPLNHYVLYRVGLPAVLAFVIILGMVLLINQALLPLWQLLPIIAGASLTAPIVSLFFATFAENKVQGFAYSKFAGISGWTIMIGWFVAEPLQLLIGIYPPFWISKAYWLAFAGNNLWWLALLIGIVSQLGLIYLLVHRFNKVAYDY